jgi:multiple sugar transport system substrate-binding protein
MKSVTSRMPVLAAILLVLILTISACAAPTPQVVEKQVVQTQVVEKQVVQTQVVEKQVVVTATPEPAQVEPAEPVSLRFTTWSSNEGHLNMLNGFAEAFRAKYPNVSVQFDTIPFADYSTKLAIQLAGSNPPDAGWMPESLAVPFMEAGALADLATEVKTDAEYDFADLSEPAMGLYLKGDSVLGIPFSTSPHLVLYNMDLFEQAGIDTPDAMYEKGEWTWENLAAAAKAIKDKTGAFGFQSVQGGIYKEYLTQSLAEFTRAWGGDIWDAEGKTCLLNTPESVASLQWYHDLVFKDRSAVPPGEEVDFFSGGAGIRPGYLSELARLDDAPFKWGLIRLPEGPAGWSPVIGQSSIVAFSASKHPDEAAAFVAFVTNKDNSKTMAQFFPSIRASVLESEEYLNSNPRVPAELLKAHVAPSIASGKLLPTHANFEKIRLAITPIFDGMWTADADVQAAMNQACEAMQPLLNK